MDLATRQHIAAARSWNTALAALNANDPASAATDPGHGPTTFKETAMDKPTNNTAAPRWASDAFHDFASGVEVNLRSTRAKLCAVHTLLESDRDPGEEVMDAVCHLIAEALCTADQMISAHDKAFTAAREARA